MPRTNRQERSEGAAGVDSLTGCYLIGPDFSFTLPRRDTDPIELGHAADWLGGPLPAQAAFVALDLRSQRSVRELTGWGGVDQFLAAIGRRINDVCPNDVVFRTGVDVFLVAMADLPPSDATTFAGEFRQAIAESLPLGDTPSALGSGVTVAVACRGAESTAAELFKRVHDVLLEANSREAPIAVASTDTGS